MRDPDVLLFIGQLEGGGAEKQCFDLAVALRALGIGVRVAGTQAAEVTRARYEAAGVPLSLLGPATPAGRRLSGVSPARIARFARRFGALRRLLREAPPFLVHSFLPYANVLAIFARRAARLPVLVAGHRYAGAAGFVYNVSQVVEAFACRRCDLNLANSQDVARFLVRTLRLRESTVRVAVNGVSSDEAAACAGQRESVRRELGLVEGAVAVGMASNLWRYKGIGDFQKAVAEARREGARLEAFVAGRDVGTRSAFEAESRRLGIEGAFHFLGGRSDVCRLLSAFDIYVSASKGEGMSNAILEAMAHGLAIVGSRAAGTSELLDGGAAGRLFDAGDWRALAHHLRELAAAPAERALLGAAAAARVRNEFRPERMVSETLRAYAEASSAHPGAASFFLRKAGDAARGFPRPAQASVSPS